MSAIGDLLTYMESTKTIGKALGDLFTSELFWAAFAVFVSLAIALVGGLFALFRYLEGKFERDVAARLDAKLRTPNFALESIEVTERAAKARVQAAEEAAQRRVEDLEQDMKAALQSNQQEHAQRLAGRLKEIETLRTRLAHAETQSSRLSQELENAVSAPQTRRSGSSVSLPNGYILVVRHADKYGALQAVEQRTYASMRRPFISYAWWYQPDGSGTFSSPTTQRGFSVTEEPFTLDEIEESSRQNTPLRVDRWPVLQIGPIHLEWSTARDGMGHVYFGPPFHHSDEYELAITNEVDITKVDGSQLKFFRRSDPS